VRVCIVCGIEFTQVGAGRPRKTCSKPCKNKRDSRNATARRPKFNRNCTICDKLFTTGRKDQVTCSRDCSQERMKIVSLQKWREQQANRPAYKITTCKWCEQELQVPSNFQGVIKYHEACKKPARQASYRVKSIRRQGVTNGRIISHDEVAQRDNFRCYLCNEPVDMELPRTSRYGATLDHVIPLTKGGQDSLDNVRLAHWICNIRKSDKSLEEYRAESR